ncbi:MAG: lactoylglutathione lyase [Oceanospirillaceae bacterium]|jgi:lactoylglutathione lyase
MRYLHTMVRVKDLKASLRFWCDQLGLVEVRRTDYESGRFTLIFLAATLDEEAAQGTQVPLLELTHNWDDDEVLSAGRNFGHLAYEVDDIYQLCLALMGSGVVINRPPRDGRMAFVKSPDNVSIELLQAGGALAPAEPWVSMPNIGNW